MVSATFKEELNHLHKVADVVFDVDRLTLEGKYQDQLSAYRAKKCWQTTLQDCFLLDIETDITLKVRLNSEQNSFVLVCEFKSSCARYAFWRLTNNHVPEAAYLLETAHIPESSNKNYVQGADLREAMEKELQSIEYRIDEQKGILQRIGELTKSFVKTI